MHFFLRDCHASLAMTLLPSLDKLDQFHDFLEPLLINI